MHKSAVRRRPFNYQVTKKVLKQLRFSQINGFSILRLIPFELFICLCVCFTVLLNYLCSALRLLLLFLLISFSALTASQLTFIIKIHIFILYIGWIIYDYTSVYTILYILNDSSHYDTSHTIYYDNLMSIYDANNTVSTIS